MRASGSVEAVEPTHPAPPLGLRALSGELPSLQVLPFADGDQLLLYTDGVTEARNHDREFYPLAEGLARHVCEEPARTLDALHDELLMYVGGRLHDDAALLLLRKLLASRTATAGPAASAPVASGPVVSASAPSGPVASASAASGPVVSAAAACGPLASDPAVSGRPVSSRTASDLVVSPATGVGSDRF